MNKVILIGRVGKTPEVKQVGNYKVAKFSLATNDGTKAKPVTTWHTVEYWSEQNNVVESYVNLGDSIAVLGRYLSNTYEKDGQNKTIFFVKAESVELLSKKSDSATVEPAAPATPPAVLPMEDPSGLPF